MTSDLGMAYLFVNTFTAHGREDLRRIRRIQLESFTADRSYCSDINWVIMDYLVSEGYPGAAEKFAQETNICNPADMGDIRERVRIRKAIHDGKVDEAVELINELDPEVCPF